MRTVCEVLKMKHSVPPFSRGCFMTGLWECPVCHLTLCQRHYQLHQKHECPTAPWPVPEDKE